jgi:hypothetical protein
MVRLSDMSSREELPSAPAQVKQAQQQQQQSKGTPVSRHEQQIRWLEGDV